MRSLILSSVAISSLLLFSGCANKVPNYANSPQNIRAVKNLQKEEKTTVKITPIYKKKKKKEKRK